MFEESRMTGVRVAVPPPRVVVHLVATVDATGAAFPVLPEC